MFILTVAGKENEGAYSVNDTDGNQILYLFEEQDDATRYAMMLEEEDYPEMHVIEVEDEVMIKTCEIHDYNYTVITSDDIVVPPDTKKFEKFIDKLYNSNVAEIKVVENFDFNGWYSHDIEPLESEDTMSILNRYIEESEINLDKSIVQKMLQEVYREACEMV